MDSVPAYLVFKNAEPVALSKQILEIKLLKSKTTRFRKGWRIVKEFAWEHQVPLETNYVLVEKMTNDENQYANTLKMDNTSMY